MIALGSCDEHDVGCNEQHTVVRSDCTLWQIARTQKAWTGGVLCDSQWPVDSSALSDLVSAGSRAPRGRPAALVKVAARCAGIPRASLIVELIITL